MKQELDEIQTIDHAKTHEEKRRIQKRLWKSRISNLRKNQVNN